MNTLEMNNGEDIFELLSNKVEIDSSYDFWYNFGRTSSEEDFWRAWFLIKENLPNIDPNSKYSLFHYTPITKKCRLLYYLFCGALRMNRLNICEECLDDLKSVSSHNKIAPNVYLYATTNVSRKFLRDNLEMWNLDWYTTHTIIGKCRVQPLKKIRKNIDRIKNALILENCLIASVENKDTEVFEYLYKINSFKYEEDLTSIFLRGLEEGNGKVIDHFINKIYHHNKNEYKWLYKTYPKLRVYIQNKNNLYQKMLSHQVINEMVCIPKDMYSVIIEKMIYPSI